MWPFGKSTDKRVEEALKATSHLKDIDLSVKVKKKVAVVTGEVPSESHKGLIKSVASSINGIKDVDVSAVTVAAAPAAAAPAASSTPAAKTGGDDTKAAPTVSVIKEDPSALAKAAYAALKSEASLADNPLDVLQSGTTILLRGAVDSGAEFDKAKALAAGITGVTAVNTSGLQVIENASQLNATDDDGDIVYTVKSGDTLSHIALHYYGDAGRKWYMKIAEANGIADANKIFVGQELKIPGTTAGPDEQVG